MPTLHVHTKFTLRHDDGSVQDFPVGLHMFDDALAEHWYVKLHAKEPADGDSAANPGDTQALDEIEGELQAEAQRLAVLKAELDERTNALDEREKALVQREADLAEATQAFEAAQHAAKQDAATPSGANQSATGGKKR